MELLKHSTHQMSVKEQNIKCVRAVLTIHRNMENNDVKIFL